jgi:hypothetical protein
MKNGKRNIKGNNSLRKEHVYFKALISSPKVRVFNRIGKKNLNAGILSVEDISPRATYCGIFKIHSAEDIIAAGGADAYARRIGHTSAIAKIAGRIPMTDEEVRLAHQILKE